MNPMAKYLFLGTFGETPKGASRPIVILYDIETLTFSHLKTVPEFYSVGEISWKFDSSGIIGVAWPNHPFPLGCPHCANRKSQLFSADLVKNSSLVEDHFSLMSPAENHHISSPRLTPDGASIVYFDNLLMTSDGFLRPGPQDQSRKLVKMDLQQGLEASKLAFQNGQFRGNKALKPLNWPFKTDNSALTLAKLLSILSIIP